VGKFLFRKLEEKVGREADGVPLDGLIEDHRRHAVERG